MIGVLLLLVVTLTHIEKPFLETRADVLELNHVYDSCAKHNFDQLIAWNWDAGEKHVDWWVLADRGDTQYRLCGSYAELHWHGGWYRVSYGEFKETWTQFDVEMNDRLAWPQECRRELPERIGVER